jgi:simple sugar transport system substrate-binding protein
MDNSKKSILSRRDFVKLAGLAGAAGALSACAPKVVATVAAATDVPAVVPVAACPTAEPAPTAVSVKKWAEGLKITYTGMGAEGDSWGTLKMHGAQLADSDTGSVTTYAFDAWDQSKIEQNVREAIAQKVDAIGLCWLGGPDTLMTVAEDCKNAGVLLMLNNIDYPTVRAAYPTIGYAGVIDEKAEGYRLGEDAWKMFGPDGTKQFKSGDHALVFGSWNIEARASREGNTLLALESHGIVCTKFSPPDGYTSDLTLVTGPMSAAILADPLIKIVVFHGSQVMGNAQLYLEAANKQAGDVMCIGTGLDTKVMDMFDKGWVQLAGDPCGFMMGFVPIMSICLEKKYGFSPFVTETIGLNITKDNYKLVAGLVAQGIR